MEKFLGAKFSGTDSEYMEELERYSDNEDGIQAAMEVKDLIETFSDEKRSEYLKLLVILSIVLFLAGFLCF